jgi:hypothetical protein
MEGVRAGGTSVDGQWMHTARVRDGGRTQSRGVRGVLMSIECALLACLSGLGFFFSCLLFNFFLRASSLYLLFLVTYLTLLDLHYIFLVSPPFLRVYVCSISAPLMTVSI